MWIRVGHTYTDVQDGLSPPSRGDEGIPLVARATLRGRVHTGPLFLHRKSLRADFCYFYMTEIPVVFFLDLFLFSFFLTLLSCSLPFPFPFPSELSLPALQILFMCIAPLGT